MEWDMAVESVRRVQPYMEVLLERVYPVKFITYSSGNTLYTEIWGCQLAWYDYDNICSWWKGSHTVIAYREYVKNGVVVKTEQLHGSFYY